VNSLKLQDVDARVPCSEDLNRLKKIWGSNFLEFGLSSWRNLHSEEKYLHCLFPLQTSDGYCGAVSPSPQHNDGIGRESRC